MTFDIPNKTLISFICNKFKVKYNVFKMNEHTDTKMQTIMICHIENNIK